MTYTKYLTYRNINLFLVMMTMVASVFAIVYLQNYLQLEPCPLCIFQRVGLWTMGAFTLMATLINPKKRPLRLTLWLGSALGVLWGMGVAVRHVWLTYLPPDKVPTCGPGLEYWLDTLPIMQVFREVLTGAGECAVVDWTLLGFSLAELTLMLFVFLAMVLGFLLKKIIKQEA